MIKVCFGDKYSNVLYGKKQNVFIVRELNKPTLCLYRFYCIGVALLNSLTTKFDSTGVLIVS